MKGMLVRVLRSAELGDCTNKGISSYNDTLILVGEGVPEIVEANGRPIVKLVRRKLSFGDYMHCEPFEFGKKRFCAGGNFIHSADSGFPNSYPIPIHDRRE